MTATLVMLVMFVIAPLALLSFGIAMEKWANRNDEEEEDEFYAI